jgi:hypothetical protein
MSRPELVHQLHAAAMIHPGVLHAAVEAKRNGGAEREGRILAPIIICRGVAHLDRALADLVGRFKARRDFACGKDLDLEFVVGGFGDVFGKRLRRAIDGIEALGEAGGQAPFDVRRALRNGGRGDRRGCRGAETGGRDKGTSFHGLRILPGWRGACLAIPHAQLSFLWAVLRIPRLKKASLANP